MRDHALRVLQSLVQKELIWVATREFSYTLKGSIIKLTLKKRKEPIIDVPKIIATPKNLCAKNATRAAIPKMLTQRTRIG
jgi:hypothetical protein